MDGSGKCGGDPSGRGAAGDSLARSLACQPPTANGWQPDANVPWWWTTDADPATAWQGTVLAPDQPLELGYDLGSVQPIGRVRILPTLPLAGQIEIRLSVDGASWYRLQTVDLSREPVDEWLEVSIDAPARYVNLIVTHPAGAGPVGSIVEVEFRADAGGNVHAVVGKLSFDAAKLAENINSFVHHIQSIKPHAVKGQYVKGAVVSATMSPSVRLLIYFPLAILAVHRKLSD